MSRKKIAKMSQPFDNETDSDDSIPEWKPFENLDPIIGYYTTDELFFIRDRVVPPHIRMNNIVKYQEHLQNGDSVTKYKSSVKQSLIDQIKTFKVVKVEAPFDRRVTFVEWHPNNPTLLAVASKSGDIFLWNYINSVETAKMIKGIGAGGSVQAMKFDLNIQHKIYTVSIEGKFLLLDFQTNQANQFLETLNYKKWFVSLDINWDTKTMVVGDNSGSLTVLSLEGEVIDRVQIHRGSSRVTHVEFSKKNPWLLCSTSNDRTIKFWDVRNIRKDGNRVAESLQTITHDKPISAAYFSLTDGCRLLTTDQFDKIFVYRAPHWTLETEINHPHRQFQHLTPIRANWHPFEDLIVVGRYPHTEFPDYTPGELRTIDFFDAAKGKLLHQHSEHGFNGISTINKFNPTGEALASASGTRILVWEPNFDHILSADYRRPPRRRRVTRRKRTKRSRIARSLFQLDRSISVGNVRPKQSKDMPPAKEKAKEELYFLRKEREQLKALKEKLERGPTAKVKTK